MTIEAKICGLSTAETLAAAVAGGAALVGFNFYPPSPRAVTPGEATALAGAVPEGVKRVGLLVDPEDAVLESILAAVPLDLLQLHGEESPARVAQIRARFGLPVMKTLKVSEKADLRAVAPYLEVADRLLFDARAPKDLAGALPGGNAVAFDWSLLRGRRWALPWMLAGGLNAANLAEAVRTSGAAAVDVASGVEDAPGVKSVQKIRDFLEVVKTL